MPEFYATMDVLVLPSILKVFLAQMEASAMGVPSVVTNM